MTESLVVAPRKHRWPRGLGAVGAALAILAFAAGCCCPDAATRLGRAFELSDVESPEVIQAGLLERMPPGTTLDGVEGSLDGAGIGKDSLSSWCYTDEKGNECPRANAASIVCRIEFDPRTMGFVKESYGITFTFDNQHLLQSIHVDRWLTGL